MNSMKKGLLTVVAATVFTSFMIIMMGNSNADNQNTEVSEATSQAINNEVTSDTIRERLINQSESINISMDQGATQDKATHEGQTKPANLMLESSQLNKKSIQADVSKGVLVPPPPGPFFNQKNTIDRSDHASKNVNNEVTLDSVLTTPVVPTTAQKPIAPKQPKSTVLLDTAGKSQAQPSVSVKPVEPPALKEPVAPAKPSALEMLRQAQKEQPATPKKPVHEVQSHIPNVVSDVKTLPAKPTAPVAIKETPALGNSAPKLVAPQFIKPDFNKSIAMPKFVAPQINQALKAPKAPIPNLKQPALNMPIWSGRQLNSRPSGNVAGAPQQPFNNSSQQGYRYVPMNPSNYYQYPMMPQWNGYYAPQMPYYNNQNMMPNLQQGGQLNGHNKSLKNIPAQNRTQ